MNFGLHIAKEYGKMARPPPKARILHYLRDRGTFASFAEINAHCAESTVLEVNAALQSLFDEGMVIECSGDYKYIGL